jgi:peroxiredoxin
LKRKDLIIILAGLFIGAGLGIVLFIAFDLGGSRSGLAQFTAGRSLSFSPAVGNPAPDFSLDDLSGERIHLADLRGKVVLINFWATWCGPCRLEMPALQVRAERFAPQMAVLAVNFDEPADQVQAFVDELGLTFPVLLDPGAEVQDLYRVRGYPTTYLVDSEGTVQFVHIGLMAEEQMDRYLSQLGVGE